MMGHRYLYMTRLRWCMSCLSLFSSLLFPTRPPSAFLLVVILSCSLLLLHLLRL